MFGTQRGTCLISEGSLEEVDAGQIRKMMWKTPWWKSLGPMRLLWKHEAGKL